MGRYLKGLALTALGFLLGVSSHNFLKQGNPDVSPQEKEDVRKDCAIVTPKNRQLAVPASPKTGIRNLASVVTPTSEPNGVVRPARTQNAETTESFQVTDSDGNDFWCQAPKTQENDALEQKSQCRYNDVCHECAHSRIIPPASGTPNADSPLACSDGSTPLPVPIYCCGRKDDQGGRQCPDLYHCLLEPTQTKCDLI